MCIRDRRNLALTVGEFGRVGSLYNLRSRSSVFGVSGAEADQLIAHMLEVVRSWKEFFFQQGVEARSVEFLEQAMLPASFFRTEPADPV